MDELIYNGKVTEDGQLKVANRFDMLEQVKMFAGKDIEVIIRKKKKVRSLAMNRYYWAEVIPKVQQGLRDLGQRLTLSESDAWVKNFFSTITGEQAHEFLKDRFIDKEEVDRVTGVVKEVKPSTAKMNTSQFQDYIAVIQQFAAETLNVQILMPNEQSEMHF